jgi:hypothetical protein
MTGRERLIFESALTPKRTVALATIQVATKEVLRVSSAAIPTLGVSHIPQTAT